MSELKRLEAAARAKVRRLERKGVRIEGSKHDPLKDVTALSPYQRRKYVDDLRRFTNRNVQFFAGRAGSPIPGHVWNDYKRLEREYNRRAATKFDEVSSLKLHTGETIGERMAKITPTHRVMSNPAANSHYAPPVRKPSQVTSERSARILAEGVNKRLQSDERDYRDAVHQFTQMMDVINEPELRDLANSLSHKQFLTLWRYSAFPTAISLNYEQQMKMLHGRDEAIQAHAASSSLNQARKMLSNAKDWKI